jgi:PAS domain S-box-containing protein
MQTQVDVERRLSGILNAVQAGILVIDAEDHKIVYANPAALRIIGAGNEEVTGKVCHSFLCPAEVGRCPITDLGQSVDNSERVVINSRRERVPVLKTVVPTVLGDRMCLIESFLDITERRRLMKELEQSEERFRSLVENTSDWIWEVDSKGTYTYSSPKVRDLLGYDPSEVLGRTPFDFMPPEEAERISAEFANIARDQKPFSELENVNLHRSRREVVLETSGVPILDSNGKLLGYRGIDRDITERKRTEAQLKQYSAHLEDLVKARTSDLAASERKYRLLVDNMADVVLTIDLKGNITFCSPPKMTGYTLQQLLSMNIKDLVAPEHLPSILRRLEARRKGETGLPPFQFEIVREDGTRLPVEIHTTLLLEENKPVGVQVIIRDITERKHMKDALRESETRFRELVDLLPQIVFETDEKGTLTFFNRVAPLSLGYTEEELRRNFDSLQLFPPEDAKRAIEKMRRIMRGERTGPDEYSMLKKDGTMIPVLIYSSAIIREGKPVGLRGVVVDITERKKMEAQLAESQRLVAIGQTAAMVGHDLRNPLQGIVGAAEVLRLELGSHRNEAISDMLNVLKNSVEYASKVISDLQDYARPIHVDAIEVCTDDLVRDTLSTIQIPNTIQVSVTIAADLEKITVDPVLMKRVLTNLILNAIQAMPDGGILAIKASRQQEATLLSVEDTGYGIAVENMNKLFEPFFTAKAQGQGLGLSVCKRLVDAHGGTITGKTQPGKGSTFTVILPIKRNAKAFTESIS